MEEQRTSDSSDWEVSPSLSDDQEWSSEMIDSVLQQLISHSFNQCLNVFSVAIISSVI